MKKALNRCQPSGGSAPLPPHVEARAKHAGKAPVPLKQQSQMAGDGF